MQEKNRTEKKKKGFRAMPGSVMQGSELARWGPSVPLRVPSESRVFASLARNSGACGLRPLGAHSGLATGGILPRSLVFELV